jgi:indoleacetamide hydrolase
MLTFSSPRRGHELAATESHRSDSFIIAAIAITPICRCETTPSARSDRQKCDPDRIYRRARAGRKMAYHGAMTDLCSLGAAAAVGAMRRGEITAETYATALLACCAACTDLNAFISMEPDAVLEAARAADRARDKGAKLGALHGVPIPAKDSINSAGLPTTAGTAALRNFRPAANAPILQALLSEGAILLGKTNLHELGLGVTSNNTTFGPCHNPYDPSRSPGGSSGGSAIAVSARMTPLAVGEDTTCSIRVPAALCGIAGLRPSTGRYPSSGVMPIAPRLDSLGPMARNVEDLILFDSVLRPHSMPMAPTPLRQVRLGVPNVAWSGLDEEVERIATIALQRLREAGIELVRADLPTPLKSDLATTMDILSYEVVAAEKAYLRDYSTGVDFEQLLAQVGAPLRKRFDTLFIAGGENAVTHERYQQAIGQLEVLRAATREYFHEHRLSAMVFPPAMTAALPIGVEDDIAVRGEATTVRTAMLRNTVHASCGGAPGLVIPAGLTAAGLPVALEFDMLPGDDAKLLSLGLSLGRVLGPIDPPPFVWRFPLQSAPATA